jgi:hypothetical protein
MPIVGSGSLYLRGQEDNKSIAFEMYENVTGSNISLHELSELASLTGSPELGQGMSEFYGFQNQAPPESVTTSAVSGVSSGAATFNGVVNTASGGVTSRGFKWMSGNQSVGTLISSGTEVTAGSGLGSFSKAQSGLSTSTGYSYVAWAENEAGRTYAGSRIYFGTLARYTYTFAQNYQSYGIPDGMAGTKSATVDQGQTATVNFSEPSCTGFCFDEGVCFCQNCICGQYNNVVCYGPGNNLGFYIQKASMNSNAAGCYNYYFQGGQCTDNCACACQIDAGYNATDASQPNYGWMCTYSCGWVPAPNKLDGRDALVFWINKNTPDGSTSAYFAGCGLTTQSVSTWQVNTFGTPTGYVVRGNIPQISSGEYVKVGTSHRFGSKRCFPGFSYRGEQFGPFYKS